ncbi:MAG: DUF2399 domain-containing protein [bacterium]|nr:DUF2399 domain-containing protein [bacterium]
MIDRDVPESLLAPGLDELWAAVRRRLDRNGPHWRGSITRPDLDRASDLSLASLLGRRPPRRLDLAALETELVRRNVGDDLCDAISRLGHPPSAAATERRAAQARARTARAALAGAIECWGEPWAPEWGADVQRSGIIGGLDSEAVAGLAADVRRLLDHLEGFAPEGACRTEIAATLFGSAHALDRGRKLATAAESALRHRIGGTGLQGRDLWEAAGVLADRVSAPVLTWALPATGTSPLDAQIRAATSGALPVHLNLVALQKYPVGVPAGTPVLVVENPRLVEAAAERQQPGGVVTTNGNPTTAVRTLLGQLLLSGARLLYHGDFDAAGLAICRRMHADGCEPWLMDASDYEEAIAMAAQSAVRLERESRDCGPTPWDPALQEAVELHRLIVHEEFVLDRVLDRFSSSTLTD